MEYVEYAPSDERAFDDGPKQLSGDSIEDIIKIIPRYFLSGYTIIRNEKTGYYDKVGTYYKDGATIMDILKKYVELEKFIRERSGELSESELLSGILKIIKIAH
jgi:hypothetical protein